MQKRKQYWLLLLALVLTLSFLLTPGAAHAHYYTTATWNTQLTPVNGEVSSNCLSPGGKQTILLGDLPETGKPYDFTLEGAPGTAAPITWYVNEEAQPYLDAFLYIGDTMLSGGQTLTIPESGKLILTLFLNPVTTRVYDTMPASITVNWGEEVVDENTRTVLLGGTFQTTLPAVVAEDVRATASGIEFTPEGTSITLDAIPQEGLSVDITLSSDKELAQSLTWSVDTDLLAVTMTMGGQFLENGDSVVVPYDSIAKEMKPVTVTMTLMPPAGVHAGGPAVINVAWGDLKGSFQTEVPELSVVSDTLTPIGAMVALDPLLPEGQARTFTLSALADTTLPLTWLADTELVNVTMTVGDQTLLSGDALTVRAGETVTVTMTLNPTAQVETTLTANVQVAWGELLQGVFQTILEALGTIEEPEPEPTEPEPTEPEPTEPEVTEPEVTEPEVTEPEVTEPEVTEPEVTEPEATEPEVTEPEVTEPTEPEEPEETEPTNAPMTNTNTGEPADGEENPSTEGGENPENQEDPSTGDNNERTPSEEGDDTSDEDDPSAGGNDSPDNGDNTSGEGDDSGSGDDTTDPPEDTTPVEPAPEPVPLTVQMTTLGHFTSQGLIPVELKVTGDADHILLTQASTTETGSHMELLPAFTRYTFDGEHFYLLYNAGTILLNMKDLPQPEAPEGTQTTVRLFLDLSATALKAKADLILVATVVRFGQGSTELAEIRGTLRLALGDDLTQAMILTDREPLTLSLPESWKGLTPTWTVRMIRAEEAEDRDPRLASYAVLDTQIQVSRVAMESERHTLTLRVGTERPPAGTYCLTLKWHYQGVCISETQITFFVNYPINTIPEKTGGAEQ